MSRMHIGSSHASMWLCPSIHPSAEFILSHGFLHRGDFHPPRFEPSYTHHAQILGGSLTGVTSVRNAITAGIVFTTSPCISSLGLYNTFVLHWLSVSVFHVALSTYDYLRQTTQDCVQEKICRIRNLTDNILPQMELYLLD